MPHEPCFGCHAVAPWCPDREVHAVILSAEGVSAVGKAGVAIELSTAKRWELEALARAQKTDQAMAHGCASCWRPRRGWRTRSSASTRVPTRVRRARGAAVLPRTGWMVCLTSRRPGRRAGSATTRSPTPSGSRSRPRRPVPRTGRCARWPGRSAARRHHLWRAFGLQPHRSETFWLSTDPLSVEEVRDIAGSHLAPPGRALALCVDERGQIQVLDRTRPQLPRRTGQVERHLPCDLPGPGVVTLHDRAHRLAEVARHVPAIGNLDGAGGADPRTLRVGAGPVAGEDLHARVRPQPGGQRLRRPIGQQVHHRVPLKVHQDRPVAMAAPPPLRSHSSRCAGGTLDCSAQSSTAITRGVGAGAAS